MKTGKTTKTVSELIQSIYDAGAGVYTTDDGNGCGGPSYIDNQSLLEMIDDDAGENYQIITETRRGIPARDIIRETLQAHGHDPKDKTAWILAEKIDDEGSNPYTHYLLLWEA